MVDKYYRLTLIPNIVLISIYIVEKIYTIIYLFSNYIYFIYLKVHDHSFYCYRDYYTDYYY